MEQERLSFADCLQGGAAARLCRGRSDLRHRGPRHRAEACRSWRVSPSAPASIPTAIYVEGISSITTADLDAADELGYRVKLLGVAVRTEQGIEQRVHPTMVPKDSAIAQVMGVTNAVTVDAAGISPITLVGPGAGGMATASAVVSDHRRHRARRAHRAVRPAAPRACRQRARRRCSATRAAITSACWPSTAGHRGHHRAAAGAAANLAGIDRAAPSRPPRAATIRGKSGDPVPVILITYATTEDAVRKALAAVQAATG